MNVSNFTNFTCRPVSHYFTQVLDPPDITFSIPSRIIFMVIYCVIFFAGFCGNLCVILAVIKNEKLQSVRNWLITSLSVSDTLVVLVSLPTTSYSMQYKEWIFGELLCHVIPLLQGMSIIISTFTLLAIALDRYILIIHPTVSPIGKRTCVILILGIWTTGIALSLPSVIHYRLVTADYYKMDWCGYYCEETWSFDTMRLVYGAFVTMLQFFAPLSIIGFCYGRIIFSLKKGMMAKTAKAAGAKASNRQIVSMKKRQRTNRMLVAMVTAFGCSWAFHVLLNILADCQAIPGFIRKQQYLCFLIAHCLAMTSTVWNPLFYGFMNEQFKAAFLSLVPCRPTINLPSRESMTEIHGDRSSLCIDRRKSSDKVEKINLLRN